MRACDQVTRVMRTYDLLWFVRKPFRAKTPATFGMGMRGSWLGMRGPGWACREPACVRCDGSSVAWCVCTAPRKEGRRMAATEMCGRGHTSVSLGECEGSGETLEGSTETNAAARDFWKAQLQPWVLRGPLERFDGDRGTSVHHLLFQKRTAANCRVV
jgi:hypothetical protein